MKINKQYIAIVLAMSVAHMARADHFTARSERRFNDVIAKHRYVVAMFYERERGDTRRDIDDLKRMFKQVSDSPFYVDAELHFVRSNVARGDVANVAQGLGIREFPAFILFNSGMPIRDGDMLVQLNGFVTRTRLQQFIDQHMRSYLEDVIESKKEDLKRRAEEARTRGDERWHGWPYYYGYYGGADPYRYYSRWWDGPDYGTWWGRPYVGIGLGGFGVGFGRGYRRGWYGPGWRGRGWGGWRGGWRGRGWRGGFRGGWRGRGRFRGGFRGRGGRFRGGFRGRGGMRGGGMRRGGGGGMRRGGGGMRGGGGRRGGGGGRRR